MNLNRDYLSLIELLNKHPLDKETNWFVMTGAPCSGKSSSLKLLEKSGYRINPDISRIYLTDQKKSGTPVEKELLYSPEVQKILFYLMTKDALSLDTDKMVLHDYSLPDNIAFLRHGGMKVPEEVKRSAKIFRFRKIFIFEPLELIPDGIRTEDKKDQVKLFELIKECYLELGYNPLIVRNDTLKNRHNFIIKNLTQNQA